MSKSSDGVDVRWQAFWVLVTPLPGVDRQGLRDLLRDFHTQIVEARDHSRDSMSAYFDWVGEALRELQTTVSAGDIDRLVLTRRYELLLSTVGSAGADDAETQASAVLGLLDAELDARVFGFAEACEDLALAVGLGVVVLARWGPGTAALLGVVALVEGGDTVTAIISTDWASGVPAVMIAVAATLTAATVMRGGDRGRGSLEQPVAAETIAA